MEIIVDVAIGSGALLAAAYCMLLSRRLRAFTRLDGDVGQAIALLSSQVDQLTRALSAAESGSAKREHALREQIQAAEHAARRLELLMAAERPHSTQRPPSSPSAVAPPEPWAEQKDGFEAFEPGKMSEPRLRSTRSRVGSRG